jgi:hypothetical protein
MSLAVALGALSVAAQPGRAADLWQFSVTNSDGSGVPDLDAGGSSLSDLLNNLVNAQGAFAPFAGVASSADVSFAGVPNVINVTVDPATSTATLTFTALGAGAQTFTFNVSLGYSGDVAESYRSDRLRLTVQVPF